MRRDLFSQLWVQTEEFLVDFWPLLVAAQQTASSSRRQKEEAAERAAAELVSPMKWLGFPLPSRAPYARPQSLLGDSSFAFLFRAVLCLGSLKG